MKVTCPHCQKEHEINPASMLGKSKKTMTDAAVTARRANGAKGGRPKKETSVVYGSEANSSTEGHSHSKA